MRLVYVLLALAALTCAWAVALLLTSRRYSPIVDQLCGLSVGIDLSGMLVLFAEIWRDQQRDKFDAARKRLEEWRTQALDWRGSEGIQPGGNSHAPEQRADHRWSVRRHRSVDEH